MYPLARAVLFKLDAERAHKLVIHNLARWPQLVKLAAPDLHPDASLSQEILGMTFQHPVTLAAGLDKDGIATQGLFACGFSAVEVGTVTPKPQPGNPSPRLFRLKQDEALVNRMGFNNEGAAKCADHLRRLSFRGGIIGVNIGKNKVTPNESAISDYEQALGAVIDVADYITINLSSPNTPGLRDLQSSEFILDTLAQLSPMFMKHKKPVFIKIAPDLADESIWAITEALAGSQFSSQIGVIATNTTIRRDNLVSEAKSQAGGLSGRPLRHRSTEVIRLVYQASKGTLPVIGCGGIFDANDAYEKIRAGASLIQIYTGFIYRGPQMIKEILDGLKEKLSSDGYSHLRDAVGVDAQMNS